MNTLNNLGLEPGQQDKVARGLNGRENIMPALPFARLPSAPLPGSSYYISNALIIAKRVALGLEDPVRIEFDGEWTKGDALFDWYQRHSHTPIESMQLRKEQKAPFFHEYVTFRLSDGTCFRIDRRQLPDERSPMGCTQHEGVEAYDTIEQIADLEDSMYNASNCLVQLDFTVDVELNLIIGICRAIYERPDTRNYTVQRYNCYFYSQTIVMCTLCTVYEWDEYYIWGPRNLQHEVGDTPKMRMPLEALDKDPDISIKISNKRPVQSFFSSGGFVTNLSVAATATRTRNNKRSCSVQPGATTTNRG
ncbi:hypothetical protein B0J17DRAFT_724172 [Rhizoctonia solani]|nr:hypothetical protein B0J17DRAFT_724172 [Rhizoctonia solani]